MCMSDLHNELQKENFKVDSETEKRITDAILKQLEDTSADVSGLAFKWCARARLSEAQLPPIGAEALQCVGRVQARAETAQFLVACVVCVVYGAL